VVAKPVNAQLMHNSNTLRKLTTLVQVQDFFFKCFKLANIELNFAVTHRLLHYTFKKLSLLHWQDYEWE